METKFQKIQNALPSIFGVTEVQFFKSDKSTCRVRSFKTGMFASVHLRKMIALCDSLGMNFYVCSISLENRLDCVEFVIYK